MLNMNIRSMNTRPQPNLVARLADGDVAETLTQYFAYVAVVCVAIAGAVGAMALSAQTALVWIDGVARPAQAIERTMPAASPDQQMIIRPTSATFAMLPATIPMRMKNDVVSSNY